ncbi:hypothetical protein [Nocardia sp. CA-145437]|uniref:hypothetical protein n=1 Tax=Nocardia sp. CA-145437 TaxID=3239980 RepID=UPI003D96CE76
MIASATALLFSAATATTAYAPAAQAWPGINYCTFDFTGTPTVIQPDIKGFGTARCTKAPGSHAGTLTLDYEDGDHWTIAEFANNNDIPAPGHDVDFRVSTHCYNGTWRMSFYVTADGDKHEQHSEYRNVVTCENRPAKDSDPNGGN